MEQVIFRNTNAYKYGISINEKEAVDLEESGEGLVGGLGGRKRKGEM